MLERVATTSTNSKLIHGQKEFFTKMVVDAVLSLDEELNEKMIGMKKVAGGALQVKFYVMIRVVFEMELDKYDQKWDYNYNQLQ